MNDSRLGRLYLGLSTMERVRLKLGWLKADEPEDPLFAKTPVHDPEYYRLMGLLRQTNLELGWYALYLEARVDAIRNRHAILGVLQLWALHNARLRDVLGFDFHKQVTESEAARRREALGRERLSIKEAAMFWRSVTRARAPSASRRPGCGRPLRRAMSRW